MGIEMNFEGKIALITGASGGLGSRFAKVLAKAGAQVVLASRRVERLKELRAEIEADGGAAHVVALDVTDYGSIRAAIAHAETEAGPVDILVNNAGVSAAQSLTDVTPEDYAFIMDVNLRGAFFVAQEAARRMVARGDSRKQHRIINIASVAGLRPFPQAGLYGMSKAALVQMTKSMALEWGRHGINVTAICPGPISVGIDEPDASESRASINTLPRRRLARPENLDGLLLLLAADESQFINGAIIPADDGLSVQ
jgi:NAD(P)-dependent dehydrogenase (short-subunit alcohol dehydrogenase family)